MQWLSSALHLARAKLQEETYALDRLDVGGDRHDGRVLLGVIVVLARQCYCTASHPNAMKLGSLRKAPVMSQDQRKGK